MQTELIDWGSALQETDMDSLRGAFPSLSRGRASAKDVEHLINLAEEYEKRLKVAGTAKWFMKDTPFSIDNCPKHKAFFAAGKDYRQRIFLASNRSGKSVAGAYETACHATGIYPDWWEGRVFDKPVNIWAMGKTGQTVRDTVQKELIGPPGAHGTGMIPIESILRIHPRQGITNAADIVRIKHISGGESLIGFKSYDQRIDAMMGTAMDVVWLDEECPELIYNECLVRTMTTNGILYVTFTPLHGLTPFIVNFSNGADYLEGAQRILAPTEDTE